MDVKKQFELNLRDADDHFRRNTAQSIEAANVYMQNKQGKDVTDVLDKGALNDTTLLSHMNTKLGSMMSIEKIPTLLPLKESEVGKIRELDLVLNTIWKRSNASLHNKEVWEKGLWYPASYTFLSWNVPKAAVKLYHIESGEARPDPKASTVGESEFFIIKKATAVDVLKDILKGHVDESGKLTPAKYKSICTKIDTAKRQGTLELADMYSDAGVNHDKNDDHTTGQKGLTTWYMYFRRVFNQYGELEIHMSYHLAMGGATSVAHTMLIDLGSIAKAWPIVSYTYLNKAAKIDGTSLFELALPTQLYLDNINTKIKNYLEDFIGVKYIVDRGKVSSIKKVGDFLRNKKSTVMGLESSGGQVTNLVHTLVPPPVPEFLLAERETAKREMGNITGIDATYTAENTGSINTTGGMQQMQAQAGLGDKALISNIERYLQDLTTSMLQLIIENLDDKDIRIDRSEIAEEESSNNEVYSFSGESEQDTENMPSIIGQKNKWQGVEFDLVLELTNETASAKQEEKTMMLEVIKLGMQSGATQSISLSLGLEYLMGDTYNGKRFVQRADKAMKEAAQKQKIEAAQQKQQEQIGQATNTQQASEAKLLQQDQASGLKMQEQAQAAMLAAQGQEGQAGGKPQGKPMPQGGGGMQSPPPPEELAQMLMGMSGIERPAHGQDSGAPAPSIKPKAKRKVQPKKKKPKK